MYCTLDCKPAFSCLFFPVFIYFSFSLHFSSKISPQLYRIETSTLVYRFTTTSCIMELKMGLLLYFLSYICSFFFLSRFFVKDIFTTVYDRNFKFGIQVHNDKLGRVAQLVGHRTHKSGVMGSIPGLATYFRFSFRFFKKGSCQLLAKVCARSTG